MNECRQSERLGAYHDGELSGAARAEMERHLGQCPACAAELERLGRLSELLVAAAAPKLSLAAKQRLHNGIDTIPMADLRRVAEICGAIAASILLVCTIWLVVKTRATTDAIPVWETVAIAQQEPATAPEEQLLAQWMVQDLSGKNIND
jgi:anti-sigma factor RsiW